MSQNLSSAAVVIGALRVKGHKCYADRMEKRMRLGVTTKFAICCIKGCGSWG